MKRSIFAGGVCTKQLTSLSVSPVIFEVTNLQQEKSSGRCLIEEVCADGLTLVGDGGHVARVRRDVDAQVLHAGEASPTIGI